MSIIFRLDSVMAYRKMPLGELARRIDLTDSNLSILKTGKARAIRVDTLNAICRELQCQPGDILEYRPDGANETADEIPKIPDSGTRTSKKPGNP